MPAQLRSHASPIAGCRSRVAARLERAELAVSLLRDFPFHLVLNQRRSKTSLDHLPTIWISISNPLPHLQTLYCLQSVQAPMRGHGSSHSFGSASVRSGDSASGSPRRLPVRAYAQPESGYGYGDGSPTRAGFAQYHSQSSNSPQRLGTSPRRPGESMEYVQRNRDVTQRGRPGYPGQQFDDHSDDQYDQPLQNGGNISNARSAEMTSGTSGSSGATSGYSDHRIGQLQSTDFCSVTSTVALQSRFPRIALSPGSGLAGS